MTPSLLTTDYAGNKIHEDKVLTKVLTEEGYLKKEGNNYTPFYYLKDHLGSNRLVIDRSGNVVQETNYYPFGLSMAETPQRNDQDIQPYKYNGKEYDRMYGWNTYDYGARMYDPAVGRFMTMDPLAEKYYSVSPYAYCLNNPIKNVDPDGRFVGTIIGTIAGGIKGAYDAHKSGGDMWAGAAEGAVAGAITGAAIDVAVAATGGGALVVIGVGVAAGAAGGATGAVAGKVATASTKAIQEAMSKNITTTATTLTTQGAAQGTVNAAVNGITKGMSTAGSNTVNSMIKVEAASATVTETTIKVTEDQLKK